MDAKPNGAPDTPMVWVAAIVSGLLMAFSNAPFDQWYLAYIAYVPLFLATRRHTPSKQGLAYALCCVVIAVNWWHSTIIFSFWFFALIVFLLCLSFFVWAYLSVPFNKEGVNPFSALVMPCLICVGIEGVLSSETVGIPCNIGISQSTQPALIQSASFFGIYTTSFLIILSNTTLTLLFGSLRAEKSQRNRTRAAVFLGVTVLAANLGYGIYTLDHQQSPANPVRIAIIQPVIDSDLYINGWRNPATRTFIKTTLDDLTTQAINEKPDILVWPEGGNGYLNMRIDELRDALYDIAVRHNTDLLISSNDLDEDGKKYNSMFSISREGILLGRYDKVNLIPGAEDSYTPGDEFHTIPSSFGSIGPSICYESNFPSPLRKVTELGAQLLVVSTSDAAFKKTSLTINHTRTAVFRAVENNRWVIHASNTGPSVIVSPYGAIVASSKFYERGYIAGDAEFLREMSFFTEYGYLLPYALSIAVLLMLVWRLLCVVLQASKNRGRHSSAMTSSGLDVSGIERLIRLSLNRLIKTHIPFATGLIVLLCAIILSSIAIVHEQVTGKRDTQIALKEFLAPLDTLVSDKVTEKFLQAKSNSCGPAVMAYVFSYFGKEKGESDIIQQIVMTEKGTSMLELKKVAIKNGFQASGVKENYTALLQEQLPVIAYINDSHYVVINKVDPYHAYLFDPAIGHIQVPRQYLEKAWNGYLLLVRMQPIKKHWISTDS